MAGMLPGLTGMARGFGEAHVKSEWRSDAYAWDPTQLRAFGGMADPTSVDSCSPSLGALRNNDLGPTPLVWQDPSSGKEKLGKLAKGPLICQVEGCAKDLALEKGYYQRYRVCEQHLKLLSLMVDGKPCRFCQQCGRFHELNAFDGNKRSCRARLQQHNARRRKRDPLETSKEPASTGAVRKGKAASAINGPRSDSSQEASHGGSAVNSQDISTGGLNCDKFSGMDVDFDQGLPAPNSRDALGPYSQHPALTRMSDTNSAAAGWPASSSLLQPPSPLLDPWSRDSLAAPQSAHAAFHSARHSSLLGSQHSEAGMLGGMHSEGHLRRRAQHSMQAQHMDTPDVPSLVDCIMDEPASIDTLPPLDDVMLDSLLAMDADDLLSPKFGSGPRSGDKAPASSSSARMNRINGMPFPSSNDTMPAVDSNGAPLLTLPPMGMAPPQQAVAPMNASALNKRAVQQQQREMEGMRLGNAFNLAGMQSPGDALLGGSSGPASHAALPPMGLNNSTGSYGGANACMPSPAMPFAGAAPVAAPARAPPPGMSSLELARRLVASGGAAAQYRSDDMLVRVSIKIANCTPDQLPPDLYQRLNTLLATADASLVQGFLRPGCTHLLLDVVQRSAGVGAPPQGVDEKDEDEVGGGRQRHAAPRRLSAEQVLRALGPAVAASGPMVVQLPEGAALFRDGGVLPSDWVGALELATDGALPEVAHVSVAAELDADGCALLDVYGRGLARPGVQLFARMQGGFVGLEVLPEGSGMDGAAGAEAAGCMAVLRARGLPADEALRVRVSGAPSSGLLQLEAQAGVLLSAPRPCVLLRNAALAAELRAAEQAALAAGAGGMASLEAFATSLGLLLDRRSYAPAAPHQEEPADAVDDGAAVAGARGLSPVLSDCGSFSDTFTDEDVFDCEKLLGWAVDAGLPRVSTFLVRVLQQYGQQLRQVLEAPYADGLCLLHRAVRSGNPAMVLAVQGWCEERAEEPAWGGVGAAGLSPLHLVAVQPHMWQVLQLLPGIGMEWGAARAAGDGATPSQVHGLMVQAIRMAHAARQAAAAGASPPQPQLQDEQQPQQQLTLRHRLEQRTQPHAAAPAVTAAPASPLPLSPAATPRAVSRTAPRIGLSALALPAALLALAALCLRTSVVLLPPYGPVVALVLCAAYVACVLWRIAADPHRSTFPASLSSVLLPKFASSRLELAYLRERAAALAPWDIVGTGAMLLMCVLTPSLTAAYGGSRAVGNAATALNLALSLLPLLVLQLSKGVYARSRSLLLLAPHCAMLSSACNVAQVVLDRTYAQYAGGPILCYCAMVYVFVLAAAGFLLPLRTQSMLMLVLISAAGMLRAWSGVQGVVTGPAAVAAAQRCSVVQVGAVGAAAAVAYARDLKARYSFLVRGLAQRKAEGGRQSACGHGCHAPSCRH